MRRFLLIAVLSIPVVVSSPSLAWWDAGHMQIAYLAYKRLDVPVREKVDALLKLNNDPGAESNRRHRDFRVAGLCASAQFVFLQAEAGREASSREQKK